MRKLSIITIFIFCCAIAVAQPRFGAKLGLNISKAEFKYGDISMTTDNLVGAQFGAIGEFKLLPYLFFDTGLMYTIKGFSGDPKDFGEDGDVERYRFHYLEIPANIVGKCNAGPLKLFAEAGLYGSAAVYANVKAGNIKNRIPVGREGQVAESVEGGINAGFGVEVKNIRIGVNYAHGLVDMLSTDGPPDYYPDVDVRPRLWSLAVTYFIF